MWKGTEDAYEAFMQDCYIVPTSYGGDTSGYQTPFTVNYVGDRVEGTYNVNTKTFTEKGSTSSFSESLSD